MRLKPYYQTELGKLYDGDCLEIMPLLDIKVDMILADIPYKKTACSWDKVIIPFEPMWKQIKRIIKDNTPIVLFGSQPFTAALILSNIKMFKYQWIWDKQSGGAFVIVKYRPLQIHEDIVVFGNKTIVYNPQMTDVIVRNIRGINKGSSGGNTVPVAGGIAKSSVWYNPKKRYPTTIISISRYSKECNSVNRVHPTQKPMELFKYLIKTYTNEGDLVLDFCIGSGTTADACEELKRKWIGIEKEKEYCEITKERIEKVIKQNIRQLI